MAESLSVAVRPPAPATAIAYRNSLIMGQSAGASDSMSRQTSTPAGSLAFPTVALLGLSVLLALASSASAHEHVTAGDLEFVVGWGEEPPVVNQLNTITINVERNLVPSGTERVTGVAANLTVNISTGPYHAVKLVEEEPGSPGVYGFPIVPTREGTYKVRIIGQINGTSIDVETEPEDVVLGLDTNFPITDPTAKDLNVNATEQQAQIEDLQSQLAALQGQSGPVTQAQLDEAKAQAGVAMLAAVAGVAAGAVGVGVGLAGVRRAGQDKPKG